MILELVVKVSQEIKQFCRDFSNNNDAHTLDILVQIEIGKYYL